MKASIRKRITNKNIIEIINAWKSQKIIITIITTTIRIKDKHNRCRKFIQLIKRQDLWTINNLLLIILNKNIKNSKDKFFLNCSIIQTFQKDQYFHHQKVILGLSNSTKKEIYDHFLKIHQPNFHPTGKITLRCYDINF